MEKDQRKLGFLQMCADRRFHTEVEEKFCETTGLGKKDYWLEAKAGGAPASDDPKTADYAYGHGARLMGWGAHGSACGGFPGVSDTEMEEKLEGTIKDRQDRYPEATHYRIFSTEEKIVIEEVKR